MVKRYGGKTIFLKLESRGPGTITCIFCQKSRPKFFSNYESARSSPTERTLKHPLSPYRGHRQLLGPTAHTPTHHTQPRDSWPHTKNEPRRTPGPPATQAHTNQARSQPLRPWPTAVRTAHAHIHICQKGQHTKNATPIRRAGRLLTNTSAHKPYHRYMPTATIKSSIWPNYEPTDLLNSHKGQPNLQHYFSVRPVRTSG